jgi:hypothetical protein
MEGMAYFSMPAGFVPVTVFSCLKTGKVAVSLLAKLIIKTM